MKQDAWSKKWDARIRKAMQALAERIGKAGYVVGSPERIDTRTWVVVFTKHAAFQEALRDDDADLRLDFYQMESGKLLPGFDIIEYGGRGIADLGIHDADLDKSDDRTMKLILDYVGSDRFGSDVITALNSRGYVTTKSVLDWDPDED